MWWEELKELLWTALCVLIIGIIITIIVGVPGLFIARYSACKKAEIYNEINGTEYTCYDFLWASDQINEKTQTINVK